MNWYKIISIVLAPLGTVLLIWIASCIKIFIINHMKNGWLKDNLLRERFRSNASESTARVTRGQRFK